MQQNNCLVLNSSLHLYTSSLRRLAEPTLLAQSEKEKKLRYGESLVVSPVPIRTPRLFSAKLLSGRSAPACATP